MLLSEKYGPEPAKFDPDRFFQTGVPVPIEQFGFGRRYMNSTYVFIPSNMKHLIYTDYVQAGS